MEHPRPLHGPLGNWARLELPLRNLPAKDAESAHRAPEVDQRTDQSELSVEPFVVPAPGPHDRIVSLEVWYCVFHDRPAAALPLVERLLAAVKLALAGVWKRGQHVVAGPGGVRPERAVRERAPKAG